MIYQNLKELGNNTLSYDDIVYFYFDGRQLKYSVQSNHLSNCIKSNNAEIFSILDINKSDFCNCYYGYCNHGGDWPTCNREDYRALTRVVIALYQEIEKRETRIINNPYLKNTILSELNKSISLLSEKKKDTSSNILVKRKSKIKKIIGEESIKLNNY